MWSQSRSRAGWRCLPPWLPRSAANAGPGRSSQTVHPAPARSPGGPRTQAPAGRPSTELAPRAPRTRTCPWQQWSLRRCAWPALPPRTHPPAPGPTAAQSPPCSWAEAPPAVAAAAAGAPVLVLAPPVAAPAVRRAPEVAAAARSWATVLLQRRQGCECGCCCCLRLQRRRMRRGRGPTGRARRGWGQAAR